MSEDSSMRPAMKPSLTEAKMQRRRSQIEEDREKKIALEMPPRRPRIAIFGGSFDPITNSHLNTAAEIVHSKLADEVWLTPCACRPDKPELRTSVVHRLIMAHLAVDTTFGSHFGVKVCDEEVGQPRNVPSVVLMRRLKEKYPEYDFSFVLGTDLLDNVQDWDAPSLPGYWEEVVDGGKTFMDENHFIVVDYVSRKGVDAGQRALPPNFARIAPALEARGSTLSSTLLSSKEVRHRMRDDFARYGEVGGIIDLAGRNHSWYDEAEGLLPPSVLGHIVRYGLYARVRCAARAPPPCWQRPCSPSAPRRLSCFVAARTRLVARRMSETRFFIDNSTSFVVDSGLGGTFAGTSVDLWNHVNGMMKHV